MKSLRVFAFVFALVVAVSAFAQNDPPTVSLKLPASAKPGEVVKGTLTVKFATGLHGYQNPPTKDYMIPVKVEAEKGTTIKKIEYPKGSAEKVAGENDPVMVYEGEIEIPVQVVMPKKAGKTNVKLVVKYQQCNDSGCFPPSQVNAAASITVGKKKA